MGAQIESAWKEYSTWNNAICQEVYGEAAAGQPAYLDLEQDVLQRVARRAGLSSGTNPAESLLRAVNATLAPPSRRASIFSPHTERALIWRMGQGSTPPPCIALLAVLSLVAERMQQTSEFAASNYYGRLAQALGVEQPFFQKLQRNFREQTPALWDTLNGWLEDCDGLRGLPTAVAFDHRRYIGLPISQALVRAQERKKLRSLFAQAGMQPGQTISVHAMREVLDDLLASAYSVPSLRRLWSRHAAKDRISEIACAELEGWDGTLPVGIQPKGHQQRDNLLLAAEFRSHLRFTIDLLLITRHKGNEDSPHLTFSRSAFSAAQPGSEPRDNRLRLAAIPGSSWASVEPNHLISSHKILNSNVSLEATTGVGTYSRRARRLVLLKRHEADNLFVEARRAELLETYLVVVVSSLARRVRQILESAARGGFRELDHKALHGLPGGWTSFARVQLERIPTISEDELTPLQPLARTHLALGGGLSLPGMNAWHRDRLPELRIAIGESSAMPSVDVRATAIRTLGNSETRDVPLGTIEGAGVVALSQFRPSMSDGDFRIVVSSPDQKRTLATRSVRVRSGSWPRRLGESESFTIGHSLAGQSSLAFFGSDLSGADHSDIRVTGALVDGGKPAETVGGTHALVPIPFRPRVRFENFEEDGWEPFEPTPDTPTDDLSVCLQRTHHYWLCDNQEGTGPVFMYCKDCGSEKWSEPKRKRIRAGTTVRTRQTPSIGVQCVPRSQPLPTIEEPKQAGLDLMLDALSYARSGSWRTLRAIASTINDSTWFARESARNLEALGHLEVEVHPLSMQPVRWAITAATIVVPEEGPAYLAGSRSGRLIDEITEFSKILGGKVRVVPQSAGPSVVEILGLETDDLRIVADEISRTTNLSLNLSRQPASRIAALLPSLNEIRRSLPELTTGATRLERLDLETGGWRPADQMDRPGAYRQRRRPWIYSVSPIRSAGDKRRVVADVRLAKHLAARDAAFSLIGYDRSLQVLLASQGAPLPGLLDRVAVLCSGRLPALSSDRMLVYERVPPRIAEAIWTAISSRT